MKENKRKNLVLGLFMSMQCQTHDLPLPPGEEEWLRYSQNLAEHSIDPTIPACKIFQEHSQQLPGADENTFHEWILKNYELYEQCIHESIEQSIKNLQKQAQQHSEE